MLESFRCYRTFSVDLPSKEYLDICKDMNTVYFLFDLSLEQNSICSALVSTPFRPGLVSSLTGPDSLDWTWAGLDCSSTLGPCVVTMAGTVSLYPE